MPCLVHETVGLLGCCFLLRSVCWFHTCSVFGHWGWWSRYTHLPRWALILEPRIPRSNPPETTPKNRYCWLCVNEYRIYIYFYRSYIPPYPFWKLSVSGPTCKRCSARWSCCRDPTCSGCLRWTSHGKSWEIYGHLQVFILWMDKPVGASHWFVSEKGIWDQRQQHAHAQKERGDWRKFK